MKKIYRAGINYIKVADNDLNERATAEAAIWIELPAYPKHWL